MEKSDFLLGEEIGHGAYGHVYVNKNDVKTCIKMSNKQNDRNYCRQWSDEYKKIKTLLTALETDKCYTALDTVRIVKPLEFIESDTLCYMKMVRIFRPKSNEPDTHRMILPVLGDKNAFYDHKGRGVYMGLSHLKKYIDDEQLLLASFELGAMMGLIHYVGRCNAFDIEVYLGTEHHTRKTRFYIADFDMTTTIKTYDAREIQEMYSSINDASYFPRPSVHKKLFKAFYDGYSSIVPKEITDKVFKDYE